MCLLLVWRVCDQAFGRYRPLKGAEKWSRGHHENWKFAYTHVQKFTDSKNAILFDLRRKIQSTEVGFSLILSIYKVVYINIKDLHAGYAKYTRKLNYIMPLKTAKMQPISLVNAWPSWIDARRQYMLLVWYEVTYAFSVVKEPVTMYNMKGISIKEYVNMKYGIALLLKYYRFASRSLNNHVDIISLLPRNRHWKHHYWYLQLRSSALVSKRLLRVTFRIDSHRFALCSVFLTCFSQRLQLTTCTGHCIRL